MKTSYIVPAGWGIVLLLAFTVFCSGCTSPATPSPAPAAPPATSAPAVTVTPAVEQMLTASLSSGVTISYPSDWERQDVLTTGVRDYGRDTINLANFFSPLEIPGDPRSYNALSIDVDKNPTGDFDAYFNQATLAVGKTYGTQMEAHSYSLKISGYDSYELDFQTNDVKGTYIFTKVDGTIYIFAFKGPNKPAAVKAFAGEIVDMYKSILVNPNPTPVPKTR